MICNSPALHVTKLVASSGFKPLDGIISIEGMTQCDRSPRALSLVDETSVSGSEVASRPRMRASSDGAKCLLGTT